jgi:hypothetical protein
MPAPDPLVMRARVTAVTSWPPGEGLRHNRFQGED